MPSFNKIAEPVPTALAAVFPIEFVPTVPSVSNLNNSVLLGNLKSESVVEACDKWEFKYETYKYAKYPRVAWAELWNKY